MAVKKTGEIKKSLNVKNDLLMENLITLQKVLINLASRVDALTNQTSKLLSLFEISAKTFAQHHVAEMNKGDKEFMNKLDQLIEQNKLIANGITMIDDRRKEPIQRNPMHKLNIKPRPLPKP